MPFVNLIQEQRLATQTDERKARTFFLVFIGALVSSAGAYGFFTMDAMVINGQAGTIQGQNKKNAPIVKEIARNVKDLADLTPRLTTLEDASVITGRWDRVLNHLALQTPKETWLTGMRCAASDPTKAIQISFNGIATGQSPIGEFILRLQNLQDLENVTLKFTNEKLVSTSKATEFEVDADLSGTAEQKVKVADGEEKK